MRNRGIDWLALMPYKYQVLFLKRLSETDPARPGEDFPYEIAVYLNDRYESFHNFISNSFTWNKTPEGHDWWSEVAFRQKYN